MNQYVVVVDKIRGGNLGDRIIVEGNNPIEALKSRYPYQHIREAQSGEEFDVELMRIEIDSYGRTFLKRDDSFYYIVSGKNYHFTIDNPMMPLQMDLKFENKNPVSA